MCAELSTPHTYELRVQVLEHSPREDTLVMDSEPQ